MTKKSLLRGTVVMAAAGVVVKLLGAVFRLPLANMIGPVGMANYSPAYYVYSFLLVFATTGFPVAISKMVSERYAVGQFREAERVFRISRALMFALGAVACVFLFVFSDALAQLINVPGSSLSMKATTLALLIVPVMASYRGYFQGMQSMGPTAISQVAEQSFRVFFGLLLSYLMFTSTAGFDGYSAEERGAAGGCFGASAGAIGGLVVMLIVYMISRKTIKNRVRNDKTTERETKGTIIKKLAAIAIPITIGATIMPIVNLMDAAIVTRRLLASGWDQAAAEGLYGQLTGFASPIIQFPEVLMAAIVMSLVPMVSAANKLGDRQALRDHVSLGLRMTTIIAFPAAIGMLVLAEPILTLLYASQKASAISAAPCLQILAVGFIFLAVITTMSGALQGIGKQNVPVINICIAIAAKLAITWSLTAVSFINVKGAAAGTAVMYFIAMTLDLLAIKRYSGAKFPFGLTVGKPLISSAVMGIIVFAVYKVIFTLLGSNGTATLISIFAGVIVYGLMVLKTKTISRDELMSNSMGRKLAYVCDKLKLW